MTSQVFVGLITSSLYGSHQNHLSIYVHNVCLDIDGWAYLFIGSIAQFTACLLDGIVVEAKNLASLVFHSKQQVSTFTVGKGYHFCSNLLLCSELLLKLHSARLATAYLILQLFFCHTLLYNRLYSAL